MLLRFSVDKQVKTCLDFLKNFLINNWSGWNLPTQNRLNSHPPPPAPAFPDQFQFLYPFTISIFVPFNFNTISIFVPLRSITLSKYFGVAVPNIGQSTRLEGTHERQHLNYLKKVLKPNQKRSEHSISFIVAFRSLKLLALSLFVIMSQFVTHVPVCNSSSNL